jgi:hypothetical protein
MACITEQFQPSKPEDFSDKNHLSGKLFLNAIFSFSLHDKKSIKKIITYWLKNTKISSNGMFYQ